MKKKQLLDIIVQFMQVNSICAQKENEIGDEIFELLSQCQEIAIVVGTELEKRGNQGEALMHGMEEYCEELYQLTLGIQEKIDLGLILEQIENILHKVQTGIIYNLPEDKKEVVFMPYKASMWDAMESVWKEYAEKEEFDTYVVPIPYYDKKPDGSVKKWNYEGNEYPGYVPITNWEQYDLDIHRPEKIYIHNPYDGYNIVTSVHPRYYSSELKKYTDELIYIPYFVTMGAVPEHFVMVPAVLNADKVIVQSEEVKQSYIDTFIKYVGKEQKEADEKTGTINEAYWEKLQEIADKKFVALGSPKFQKVQETKREDVTVPENWKNLIMREDGSEKKILLYNTTIEALLTHSETYLKKIQAVLKIMKEQRDIVFLWRPHPLLQSTLDAMMPDQSELYQHIVRQYREEGWGIFDDTADLNRAIAISDAYYGDWSSLVALYKETGKPIMIQDVERVIG